MVTSPLKGSCLTFPSLTVAVMRYPWQETGAGDTHTGVLVVRLVAVEQLCGAHACRAVHAWCVRARTMAVAHAHERLPDYVRTRDVRFATLGVHHAELQMYQPFEWALNCVAFGVTAK